MGRHSLSKGDRLRAMHQALLNTVGPYGTLTLKEVTKIFGRCFDVWSRAGIKDQLDIMDLADYIRWHRERTDKDVACLTVLPRVEIEAMAPIEVPA